MYGLLFQVNNLMYFPGMKLGSKIFSFIDIFMATYQRFPKTETAGPPGERVQPFAIPAHPCVCVHDNSKNNGSIHLKLEHIVVYENSSDEFDNGQCPIKVKVTA